MVSVVACERVQGAITEAREQQVGRFLTEGETAGDGCRSFVTPTLIAKADLYNTIAQKEVFGPVLSAFKFRGETEALALQCRGYGLVAYVRTNDLNIARF